MVARRKFFIFKKIMTANLLVCKVLSEQTTKLFDICFGNKIKVEMFGHNALQPVCRKPNGISAKSLKAAVSMVVEGW